MTHLTVAVVGGGIGGLAAAHALRAKGIDVDVFEQAPAFGEVGAGVQIAPNGLRMLDRIGVGDAVRDAVVPFGPASTYRREDGSIVASVVIASSDGDYPVVGAHRADLLDALLAPLPPERLHTGHQVAEVVPLERGSEIRFSDGRKRRADVVVGADGIHSRVRLAVTEPSAPQFSGSIAYRGLVPRAQVPDWPTDAFEVWMGGGKHLLTFPVRGGTTINVVGFVPTDDEMRESWSAPGDPADLAAEFAGWDERTGRLLARIETTNRWGLYDRQPLAGWTVGSTTLLGDAAHPMLPHVGQGANQAIEDAAVLAELLADTDADSAPAALQQYSDIRLSRTAEVQAGSRRSGKRYDSQFSDLEARDTELESSKKFRRWLYDTDVVADLGAGQTSPSSITPTSGRSR